MRHSLPTLATLAALVLAGPACAQGKPLAKPASDAMPPVELTIGMDGGKPVCEPAELRLPADTNVTLNIVSRADTPVTITAAGQFENAHVLHADGDLIHAASEKGYTVKQNGKGTLRLRTMSAGEVAYGCTSNRNADAPFVGRLILSAPAG
ncbi:cupredoxin domain-containing protein [Methylobacterium trifolii]|uniref:Anaerobic typically selenocysteine-containing protein n=1 Tax=Methylobacterium trifolii TaxID=1003092 RepID=A0ABQ4TSZ8_9HYPH|nr:cupredoxin domain-containing protein [Methylobacterium trifolii]GJE58315.1 hypothetical protein MPOCJGCO_0394 [Methylobacterium trifolii]